MPKRPPSPSSSRSSETPPPQVVVDKKKKKSSGKEKPKKSSATVDQGKNEGADLNWAYVPPPGAVLIEEDEDADAGEFDWDNLKNDDNLELCLIRVPDSVKPKHLQDLKISLPSSPSSSSQSGLVGVLKRKVVSYDIWSVGNGDAPIGGEEIKGLSCLLPRGSKKGKLYPSPKPIALRLVFAAQPVTPTPDASIGVPADYKNPPRHTYPKEILKHRFIPYGSVLAKDGPTENEEEVTAMDVDTVEASQPTPPAPPSPKKKRSKNADVKVVDEAESTKIEVKNTKEKGKKRKVEVTVDIPTKKAKKTKTS